MASVLVHFDTLVALLAFLFARIAACPSTGNTLYLFNTKNYSCNVPIHHLLDAILYLRYTLRPLLDFTKILCLVPSLL